MYIFQCKTNSGWWEQLQCLFFLDIGACWTGGLIWLRALTSFFPVNIFMVITVTSAAVLDTRRNVYSRHLSSQSWKQLGLFAFCCVCRRAKLAMLNYLHSDKLRAGESWVNEASKQKYLRCGFFISYSLYSMNLCSPKSLIHWWIKGSVTHWATRESAKDLNWCVKQII